jgi:Putative prokaryotic signal transducing protein
MICPNCKCEYIRGITQCADCGVTLVDKLEPDKMSGEVSIVSVWQGNDPAECERVKAALENAGIEFLDLDNKGFNPFAPSGAKVEIWVPIADREAARKIILDEDVRVDARELTPEEIESLALPESDPPDGGDAQAGLPEDLPEYWYEDGAVVEVWNGESEEFADTLIICLREIGIPSQKIGESSPWSLVVPQKAESRAREVVREVVEARPPE